MLKTSDVIAPENLIFHLNKCPWMRWRGLIFPERSFPSRQKHHLALAGWGLQRCIFRTKSVLLRFWQLILCTSSLTARGLEAELKASRPVCMRAPLQLKVSCCERSLYEYWMSHMGPQVLNQWDFHDHNDGNEKLICKETCGSTGREGKKKEKHP